MTGKQLKELLDKLEIRQRRFADLAGLKEPFLSNFLNGRIKFNPGDDRFVRMTAIANALEVGEVD